MEGVQLTSELRAREIVQRLGVRIRAVGAHDDDQLALIVVVGEIERHLALLGRAHAGDDRVELAAHHAHRQAVPLGLDDFQLHTQSFGDQLGDLHVVAVGIPAARKRHGRFALLSLRPVERRVVTLHTHAQRALGHRRSGKHHHQNQNQRSKPLHCHILLIAFPDHRKSG